MKKRREFLRYVLGGVAGLAGGCAMETKKSVYVQSEENLEKKVIENPLIVAIEGAFVSGWLIHNFTGKIAHDLGLAQTVGQDNYMRHMEYIEKADKQGNEIILFGYSAGCGKIRNLAEKSKEKNIDVGLMIYIDPTYAIWGNDKVPSNVNKVICYKSDISGLFEGRALNKDDFESSNTEYENKNIKGTDHWNIIQDERTMQEFRKDIKEFLENK
jgi:hypothetical protein